ncbi:hypothetical protein BC936DRAFT_142354 [Jimgerdemannia flammicorona]|uniref:BHLH domain-containing protein n=1 Tax=Jimgerdemannia flammicorona TaxID=994334 RepID=A0A433A0H3_9FUNG|nr:hypothetical protein BC936DRAFT_142354 [Jimgerdemannia flammicorona]
MDPSMATQRSSSSTSMPLAADPLMSAHSWAANKQHNLNFASAFANPSGMELDQNAVSNAWWFDDVGSSGQQTFAPGEILQEPVPFEDFQFNFGLDPGFSIPLPLDIPPPPFPDPLLPAGMPSSALNSPSLTMATISNHPLLNENDQKLFTNFLDGLFDQDFVFDPQLPSNLPTLQTGDLQLGERRDSLDTGASQWEPQPKRRRSEGMVMPSLPQPAIPISTPSSMMMMPAPYGHARSQTMPNASMSHVTKDNQLQYAVPQQQQQQQQAAAGSSPQNVPTKRKNTSEQIVETEDRATPRKTAATPSPSTARNTQANQQATQAKNNTPASSTPTTMATLPTIKTEPSPLSQSNITSPDGDEAGSEEDDDEAMSPSSGNGNSTKRKPYKELLTEEEKRANHIQSEQKRRNTIRAGFRDLTDLVPTLKNVNNSKSTILFKAVEYIRYLERRNRGLREKVGGLEMRVEMEGRSHGAGGGANGNNGNSMGGAGGNGGNHRRGAGAGGNGGNANGGAGMGGGKRTMGLMSNGGATNGYYPAHHHQLNATINSMAGKPYPHHPQVHYASAQPQHPGGGYQQIRYNESAAAVLVAVAAAQAAAQAAVANAVRTPEAGQDMERRNNGLHLLYTAQQYPHGNQQQQQRIGSNSQPAASYYAGTATSLTIPADNEEEEDEDDEDDEGKEGIDSGYSESGERELGNATMRQSVARNIAANKAKTTTKTAESVMMMNAGRDLNMGVAAVSS